MSNGQLIIDDDDRSTLAGWDTLGHQVATAQMGSIVVDSVTGAKTGAQITEDQIRAWIINGQSFVATTGSITAGSSNTFGMAVFHPATTTKNMFIYSLRFSNNGGSSMAYLYIPTVNPALGNAATVNNAQVGGSASAIASSNMTYATTAASVAGTLLETAMVPQSAVTELLPSGLFVPALTAGGIALYDFIANAAAWSATVRWIEY